MKLTANKKESGGALVTALIISVILGLVIGSYLLLIADRNYLTQRSQAWNTAIPVLEAGIEEAFTHVVDDGPAYTANGWIPIGINGTTVYTKQRNFTNGCYCIVTISNVTSTTVDIYSQGFVPVPMSTNFISRKVQVLTTNPISFSKAVSAKGLVSLSGSAVVDSFNSTDPRYSTNGMYTNTMHETNGDIVTDSTNNPAVQTSGGAKIEGTVDTGPGGVVSGSSGVTGAITHDMNVVFPDQVAPTGASGWLAPSSGKIGVTNYQYVLSGGDYKLSSLTISQSGSGQPVIVTGAATLYVTGDITVSGSGYIYLAPTASLTLIEGGTTATISGSGVVNSSGYAKNFSYIGLPANTSLTYSGSAGFTGTVDAPEAKFTISGSAAMVGAAIVNSFDDSGGAAIHFDEGIGGRGQIAMTSYKEL